MESAHHKFFDPEAMSLNHLLCPNQILYEFNLELIKNREEQQLFTFTFKKLEPEEIFRFSSFKFSVNWSGCDLLSFENIEKSFTSFLLKMLNASAG